MEITREKDLTERGNCVVAVDSSVGLIDLPAEVKKALADERCKARLTLKIADQIFCVEGRGDPRMTLSHPTDFVIRKSGFVSDRTLMVHANRSAADIPRSVVRLLSNSTQKVVVNLVVES